MRYRLIFKRFFRDDTDPRIEPLDIGHSMWEVRWESKRGGWEYVQHRFFIVAWLKFMWRK